MAQEAQQEPDGHILRRWVSMGDVLVMLTSLSVFAFGYGQLSRDVASLTRAMQELQGRDITPGARASIERITASVTAQEAAQNAQISELRIEMREQRREIMESLARLEAQLDNHDRR